MDAAAPPSVTARRFNYLHELQVAEAIEPYPPNTPAAESSGLAFHSVTGERGQLILSLWRANKQKGHHHHG